MRDLWEKINTRALSEQLMERSKIRLDWRVWFSLTLTLFRKLSVDGREVVVGVWDTAGSERYESMVRMYYR